MTMKIRMKTMNKLAMQDGNQPVSYEEMISPSANWRIITNNFGVDGIFSILQLDPTTSQISFSLEGVPEGSHSVYIHESQVYSTNWQDSNGNYDPYRADGEEADKANNYGQNIWNLGVLNSPSKDDELEDAFYSQDVKLFGQTSVIYRSIVIHERDGSSLDDNNQEVGPGAAIAWCNISYT